MSEVKDVVLRMYKPGARDKAAAIKNELKATEILYRRIIVACLTAAAVVASVLLWYCCV